MYSLVPEKKLRLVYEPFYLAIYNWIRDLQITHFQLCCISNGFYELFSSIGARSAFISFLRDHQF